MSVIVSCKTHLSKHNLSTPFWLFYNMCLLQDNLINYCVNCPYFAQFGCTLYKMKRIYLSLCEGSSIVLWRLVWWYQSFEANLPVWKYKWQVCCVCVGGGTWSWAVEPILDSCFVITPVGSKQTIFKNWLQLRSLGTFFHIGPFEIFHIFSSWLSSVCLTSSDVTEYSEIECPQNVC